MGAELDRRGFLRVLGAGVGAAAFTPRGRTARAEEPPSKGWAVIATWAHGVAASKKAALLLASGRSALDALEQGVMVCEDDPLVDSVGKGGLPNAEGEVELDAAIMRGADLAVGAVAGLKRIRNPIAVARHVLDDTPHVLLVGEGARAFALAKGFQEEDLLTERSKKAWEYWRAERDKKKDLKSESRGHDTVGMVAIDSKGELAAACSTSGLAWKLPGRVGDSPIVGAGLYCDGKIGGASATGIGEEVLRVAGSFQVVEGMRRGLEPAEAIREVLRRIRANPPRVPGKHARQVGFVALRRDGASAALSLAKGFQFALARPGDDVKLADAQVLE
ncbi:N(4)-(beta-N-acetylglucosaminyl)-L-asparaginase [bacterium]|nr:N(4)-(beta-N-acetylglucosaminyl)-L-asparaginase [bacterium]